MPNDTVEFTLNNGERNNDIILFVSKYPSYYNHPTKVSSNLTEDGADNKK